MEKIRTTVRIAGKDYTMSGYDSEDYVHRIGRTARANNDGCAITFVSEKEQTRFKAIEDFLDKTIYKIPVPEELGEAPEYTPRSATKEGKKRYGRYGGKGKKNYLKKARFYSLNQTIYTAF